MLRFDLVKFKSEVDDLELDKMYQKFQQIYNLRKEIIGNIKLEDFLCIPKDVLFDLFLNSMRTSFHDLNEDNGILTYLTNQVAITKGLCMSKRIL